MAHIKKLSFTSFPEALLSGFIPYLLLLTLSMTDLFMTQALLQSDEAIIEGNPIMSLTLQVGSVSFILAKLGLTLGGLGILRLCQPFRPTLVERVLLFLMGVYAIVVFYEIILLFR